MAFLLLHNILFAQRFDLYPPDPSKRTFAQQFIGFVSAGALFGCAIIIHFYPTIGSNAVFLIGLIVFMTRSLWMNVLYEKFMKKNIS
jgi:hypothetical protein